MGTYGSGQPRRHTELQGGRAGGLLRSWDHRTSSPSFASASTSPLERKPIPEGIHVMNTLETIVLGLVVSWLVSLTFVLILIVRQIGLITVRFDLTPGPDIPLSDGPEVGTTIPEGLLERLAD